MPSSRRLAYRRLRNVLRHRIYSRLYRDTDRDLSKSVIVAGAARSGTTWVAQIIASQVPARIMFEPFHSGLVSDYARFNYFQYRRPDDSDDELYDFCSRVFTGSIRHPWIDRMVDTLAPEMRIIKEIRANLLLKWIKVNFPAVPILFVIRHPCAVVSSRLRLDWATDDDISPLLSQPDLIHDHLPDQLDIIKNASTPEQKHAIIWCISNLIPLKQFASGGLTTVFYEHLCVQPETELPRVFNAAGLEYDSSAYEMLARPSPTATLRSAITLGQDRVTQWRSQLSLHQVEDILSVVRAFDLEHLYGDSTIPISDVMLQSDGDAITDTFE